MKCIWRVTLGLLLLVAVANPSAGQSFFTLSNGSYLGIYMTDLSDGTRRALGLEEGQGVLVEDIVQDEPADKAGMQTGDVILEFNGRDVSSSSELGRLLNRAEPGESVEVIVWRERKRVTLSLEMRRRRRPTVFGTSSGGVLAATPELYAPTFSVGDGRSGYSFAWGTPQADRHLGVRTQELTGQLADYFEVGRGVLITWVVPNSPAGQAGVRAGDILVALAGQPVASEEDLGFILSAEDDATEITLEVIRRGEKKSLTLEL